MVPACRYDQYLDLKVMKWVVTCRDTKYEGDFPQRAMSLFFTVMFIGYAVYGLGVTQTSIRFSRLAVDGISFSESPADVSTVSKAAIIGWHCDVYQLILGHAALVVNRW